MAKVTLFTIANLDNPNTVVSQLNQNFARLVAQIDLLMSRDGESPNTVLSNLDLNGFRILNLPAPISDQEPARHGDIQQYVDDAEEAAEEAAESAEEADEARDDAVALSEDFKSSFGGVLADDPSVDGNGDPLSNGFFYYSSTLNQFRYYSLFNVQASADEVIAGADDVYSAFWTNLPTPELRGLTDVSLDSIADGQTIVWDSSQEKFLALTLDADVIEFDNTGTMFDGDSVQEALEEVSTRTSLGSYDIHLYAQGFTENAETIFRMVAARDFTIPLNATGSRASAGTAPNASTTLTFKKNGSNIGTVVFATATGSFTFGAAVTFTAGDILTLVNQATADTALKDIAITIKATR